MPLALATIGDLRTPIVGEGFLHFLSTGDYAGQERFGGTGVQHPSTRGANDNDLGYDISWNRAPIHATVLKDKNGNSPGGASDADIRRDFDYANAAFAQAGITVLMFAFDGEQQNSLITFDLELSSEMEDATKQWRGASDVTNLFYVSPITFDGGFNGITFPPNAPGVTKNTDDGLVVASDRTYDTVAHELGHFLLGSGTGSGGTHIYKHVSGVDEGNHAAGNRANLMAPGGEDAPDGRFPVSTPAVM